MRKKLLILVTLFLLVLTCTASANFVQLNRTSVGARLRDVRYITTFNDYGSKFRFSFRSQGHKPGVLTVKKDNKVIYSDKVPFAGYAYMNRIQDEDSGRIFYILGNTELRGIIMGYDPQTGKWIKYVDSDLMKLDWCMRNR